MTALEWLEDNIQFDMTYMEIFGLIRQAKEMEKQQITDACKYGNNFEQGDLNCHSYYDKYFKNNNK